jgi:vitamin B12 transporter
MKFAVRALVLSACVLPANVSLAQLGGLDAGIGIDAGPAAEADDAAAPLELEPAPPGVIDVTVRSKASAGRELIRSSDAVTVVDLSSAQKRAADMGEVLSRVQGVSLRRAGGLGSPSRFSLNGLYDDQVRFMLDGVPLEYAGFPFGIANSPVNLVERIEIYRGVVPIRFGSDALGGAVNMVTDQNYETRGRASYELGSFGLQRATVDARYKHDVSGFVAGATGFFDYTRNDYPINVFETATTGQRTPVEVERRNDHYLAYGAIVEAGVVDRRWADKLMLRGFYSGYDKQLPHNVSMTVPYGDITYGEQVGGVTASYKLTPRDFEVDVVANYSHRSIDYRDISMWVYDWRDRRGRMRTRPGEAIDFEGQASDSTQWQHGAFARATVSYRIASGHLFRASLTPNVNLRTGENRAVPPGRRDALDSEQRLITLVSGLEYELGIGKRAGAEDDYRFKNSVFAKGYTYRPHTEQLLDTGMLRVRDNNSQHWGAGDQLRLAVTDELAIKVSYEYATRLPRPDEVFGNGVVIQANPTLKPERSHNANLGPRFELRRSPAGSFVVDLNAFVRKTEKLILPLGSDRNITYQNVYGARAFGLEGQLQWISPGRYVLIDFTPSWIDQRNSSRRGAYGEFEGDRLPNRPYLFASWTGQLRFAKLLHPGDTIEPFYEGRWVHEFYRGWESQGLQTFKQIVDRQISHDIGFVYSLQTERARGSLSFEIANLTDARVYDFFGVQRPGRGYYVKLTGSL